MNAAPDLEERLRRGLRQAAAHLPEARPRPPTEVRVRPAPVVTTRIRVLAAVAYTAAAALFVVSAVVTFMVQDSTDIDAVPQDEVPPTTAPTTTTTEPPAGRAPAAANGMVPGAVLVDRELRLYGPDGRQTGRVRLAVFDQGVSSVASDLDGGWVACGLITVPDPSPLPANENPPHLVRLMWFPRDGDPVELATEADTPCGDDAVRVVDSADGATAIYVRNSSDTGPDGWLELGAVVLETGEKRDLGIVASRRDLVRWSAATDRVVTLDAVRRLQLWDLGTGETLPIGPIPEVDLRSSIALSPDATTLAVLDVFAGRLTIYDVSSGEAVFDRAVPVGASRSKLSYDGDRVAIGIADADRSTEVIDVETGESYTIEAFGVLP